MGAILFDDAYRVTNPNKVLQVVLIEWLRHSIWRQPLHEEGDTEGIQIPGVAEKVDGCSIRPCVIGSLCSHNISIQGSISFLVITYLFPRDNILTKLCSSNIGANP